MCPWPYPVLSSGCCSSARLRIGWVSVLASPRSFGSFFSSFAAFFPFFFFPIFFFWWHRACLYYFDSFHFVSCYVLLSGSWETVTIPQQYQKIPLPAYGAAVLNGDASSHPFHSLPPPPPPPPHSHQTLFSSFGYRRLSPSSADEPRDAQGSSSLASCSPWTSCFSFNVCIESFSFYSASPLCHGGFARRCVQARARGCVYMHAGGCMRVHAAGVCGVCTCACRCPLPCTPSPAALSGPRHIPPSPPCCPQDCGQCRAALSTLCSCPRSVRMRGDPQKHPPGSVPGAGLGSTVPNQELWEANLGAETLCSLPTGYSTLSKRL